MRKQEFFPREKNNRKLDKTRRAGPRDEGGMEMKKNQRRWIMALLLCLAMVITAVTGPLARPVYATEGGEVGQETQPEAQPETPASDPVETQPENPAGESSEPAMTVLSASNTEGGESGETDTQDDHSDATGGDDTTTGGENTTTGGDNITTGGDDTTTGGDDTTTGGDDTTTGGDDTTTGGDDTTTGGDDTTTGGDDTTTGGDDTTTGGDTTGGETTNPQETTGEGKADAKPVVSALAAPDPAVIELVASALPTMEEALEMLPKTLSATLSDGNTEDVAVTWSYQEKQDDDYIFIAALAEDAGYAAAEGIVCPTCAIRVIAPAITRVEAPEKNSAEVTEKPALADVIAKLPEKLTAVLSDGTTTEVAVTWSCPDYADRELGEFKFTAALAEGVEYELEEGVEMPVCTLTVVNPATNDYEYTLNEDGEATLIKYLGDEKATELVVPDTVDDHPVTAMDDGLFKDMALLESVTLPKELVSLGANTFENCVKLNKLTLPDSLEEIGDDLFKGIENETLEKLAITLRAVLPTERESTMTGENSFQHVNIDEETNAKETIVVSLPAPVKITDILADEGEMTIDTDFTVAAEHTVTVQEKGTLKQAANRTLTNFGAISNGGKLSCAGTVINCAGSYSGKDIELTGTGSYTAAHNWQNGTCTVCGQARPAITLSVGYFGYAPEKVYDGTSNVSLNAGDFRITGGVEAGDEVYITGVSGHFDSSNAGNRTVNATVSLGGANAAQYIAPGVPVSGKITPKTVVINPVEGVSKTFGTSDPARFSATVKKGEIINNEKVLSGALSREKAGTPQGENVGEYAYTLGTLSAGDNYKLEIKPGVYFTITKKDIASADISVAPLGNKRYTGEPITPAVTMRYGNLPLTEGVDYTLEYANNVGVSTAYVKTTATITIKGKGNYSGERKQEFVIIASGASSYSGSGFSGGSSGGSYGGSHSGSRSGGSSGTSGAEDTDDSIGYFGDDETVGHLILNDIDYGTILFNAQDEPRPFTLHELVIPEEKPEEDEEEAEEEADETEDAEETDEETDELIRLRLTIEADPAMDAATGKTAKLSDGRDRYETLHLKLTPTIIGVIRDYGVTELVYKLEDAELRMPIESLPAEIELPMEESQVAEDEVALDAPRAEVELYDISITQAQANGLSERETFAVEDLTLLAPMYRLTAEMRVKPYDSSEVETRAALDFMEDVNLFMLAGKPVEEDDREDFEGYRINDLPTLSYGEAVDSDTVEFVDELAEDFVELDEDRLYAVIPVTGDGLYLVGSEEYEEEEDDDEEEGDYFSF